jgi:hypothetical protein
MTADYDLRACWAQCRKMGRLAHWWLRPEVLDAARRFDPARSALRLAEPLEVPEKLGDCWLVLRAGRHRPLYRPAFLLPLSWRPDRGHSPCLPPRLAALADRVLADLKIGNDWGLHPADELQFDSPRSGGAEFLSRFRMRCASGWASLAGGLIARAEGLLPKKSVWASGAWDKHGLADVRVRARGRAPKLELAARWPWGGAEGRTEKIQFFVPSWRAGEAVAWVNENAADERVMIGILDAPPGREPQPRQALNAYVAALTSAPPVPDASAPDEEDQFARCRNWFLHQTTSVELDGAERSFYWSHLLPGIIRRMHDRVRKVAPPDFAATHCATFVSWSHELAVFTPLALGVTHCLLLHTPDSAMGSRAAQCAQILTSRGLTCVTRPFDEGADMLARICREVAEFTRGVPAEHVALDLKPGTKKMTYSLVRAARPGNWLFILDGDFLRDRRTDPGTEKPELWRAGE